MTFETMPREEFLLWEAMQHRRYELVDGFALATSRKKPTATIKPSVFSWGALISAIVVDIQPYKIYATSRVESARYPDVVATSESQDEPIVIVKVITDFAARENLGSKIREYHSTSCLREYLVIDFRKRWARLASRTYADCRWSPIIRRRLVDLRESIRVLLDADWIYDRVSRAGATRT